MDKKEVGVFDRMTCPAALASLAGNSGRVGVGQSLAPFAKDRVPSHAFLWRGFFKGGGLRIPGISGHESEAVRFFGKRG